MIFAKPKKKKKKKKKIITAAAFRKKNYEKLKDAEINPVSNYFPKGFGGPKEPIDIIYMYTEVKKREACYHRHSNIKALQALEAWAL